MKKLIDLLRESTDEGIRDIFQNKNKDNSSSIANPRLGKNRVRAIGVTNDLNTPPSYFVQQGELKAFMNGEMVPGYDSKAVDGGPDAEVWVDPSRYKYVILYMDK